MNVGKVRSAIEGLNDDAEVVLYIKNAKNISLYKDLGFKLDTIRKSTGGDPRLDVFVSVFDAGDWYDGDEDDGLDDD